MKNDSSVPLAIEEIAPTVATYSLASSSSSISVLLRRGVPRSSNAVIMPSSSTAYNAESRHKFEVVRDGSRYTAFLELFS